MRIYDRDYTKLTEDEINEWEMLKKKEVVKTTGKFNIRKSMFRKYPKAVRHYLSIFPNNYLDIEDLKNEDMLKTSISNFYDFLSNENIIESDIAKFIKNNKAYFIIGSILKSNYNFGHHDAFIIPEFMLGNSYKVDYLLIGKNSGGYEFVFVELENPYGKITLKDGNLGDTFRKGIKQVFDWDEWLESNYVSLRETFQKYKNPNEQLPNEFFSLDKTRIHYAVVAGRRDAFNLKTYKEKRRYVDKHKILLLHYDNLCDSAKSTIGKPTY
ncbi:protein of unknown function [Proteiniborus ethanoligenes]|jgi:hypothetical protein|uniref:Shedu protein SduA C-terminal domain-containing protein n=1 Tax=Proteiniborus ethanoligenes TaxID=415015 RepID=A0A1H3PGV6_9FIRM|nr:Shedu anti-phage system protein SduA domain-containing protein [Proteiniborus ethanoligenes]SDY99629.1 protein of unknown function [Proteiniborus ethanoligenes]